MELIETFDDEVEIQLTIGELFEKFEKLKNIEFSNTDDDEVLLHADEIFQVKNEHNEWVDVLGLVTKFDSTHEFTFESGITHRGADNHLLCYDGLHTKFMREYSVGETVIKADKNVDVLTDIRRFDTRDRLYDLQVASDTHLYQTSNGLIHHNSVGLINLSWNYIQQGKDVVYISLELKEAKIMKRYITHSSKIPTHLIPSKETEIFNHIKRCDSRGFGRFTTHFYQPSTLNAMKLELFIRNYIQKYNSVPIIIVDYAGLMVPNAKGWQGMFERDKYVSEELRGVATLFDTVIWTADQYNRCIAEGETVETPDGLKNIEDVIVGDFVFGTDDTYREVLAVTDPEEQDVYEITTESGKTVMVSARHIFPKLFNGEIIEDNIQSSLQVGDTIFVQD